MIQPSLDEFRALARLGNRVPVYRTLLADCLTPVTAFHRIAADSPFAFLLESVVGGERVGRYSFLGADPFLVFRSDLKKSQIARGKAVEARSDKSPLDLLAETVAQFRVAPIPELPRFCGGAVGYASYDAVRMVERLPHPPARGLGLPDLFFGFYDSLVVFDHVRQTCMVIAHADVDADPPEAAYKKAVRRIDDLCERLASGAPQTLGDIQWRGENVPAFDSNVTQAEYEAMVSRMKDYIAAGDIIQAVPSQRLSTAVSVNGFDLYRVLRVVNPSPYMFYLRLGDLQLVGSSPEVMVRVEDRTVTVRPIAGTRPRGKTPEEDAALAAELLADPKERAEHVMLLDLGRNDVGRVSDLGSVRVTEEMVIERYSHVMHIVSNVEGRLRKEFTAFDALKSCLPAGTVSGAPKVRAMEIIDELEPDRRGPYAGAVGYLDFHGNLDTCIALRTVALYQGRAYVQVGAGIVADSVPAKEYEETLNKARAMLRAIAVAEKTFGSGL
jgi:anthranilate synthase component I